MHALVTLSCATVLAAASVAQVQPAQPGPSKPAPAKMPPGPAPSKPATPLRPAPQQPTPAPTQDQLKAWRVEKLEKPVWKLAPWLVDLDAARAEASKTGKPIFACFTRSYLPCAPCEALESSVLADARFAEFASSVVLFLHVTSHVEGEPYPTLLTDKGFTGFPSLCFLDQDGNVVVKQVERSVAGFEATAARIATLRGLEAQLKKGGGIAAERRVFLAQLELQMLRADEIRARMQKLELGEADRARADQFLVDAEVRDLRTRSRELGPEQVSDAVAAMARAGRRPSPSPETANPFWELVLGWSARKADGELGQKAFDALSENASSATVLQRYRQLLERAKGTLKK